MRQKGIVEDVMKQLHFDTGGSETQFPETMKPATHFVNREEKFAINLTGKKGKKYILNARHICMYRDRFNVLSFLIHSSNFYNVVYCLQLPLIPQGDTFTCKF